MKRTTGCLLVGLMLAFCLGADALQGAVVTWWPRQAQAAPATARYRALSRTAVPRDQAQSEAKTSVAATPTPGYPLATLRREFKSSLPIPVGEKLEYEVRYARFPLYATVGLVTFEYLGLSAGAQTEAIKGLNAAFTPAPEAQFFRFRATAISKGLLLGLLGLEASDRFETLVDTTDFSARVSFKEIKEGKKHVARTSLFDQVTRTVNFTAHDLTKPEAPPRTQTLPRQEGMLDLLSAFYFVRLQKLKERQMLRFPVNDDDTNYTFDIVVGQHDKLKTDCGTIKTIKVEPKLFGPSQLFPRSGEMMMWLSDDNRRVPLRLVAKTSSGTITAKLLNFKKDCRLLEPEEGKGDAVRR